VKAEFEAPQLSACWLDLKEQAAAVGQSARFDVWLCLLYRQICESQSRLHSAFDEEWGYFQFFRGDIF
jgi:DNA-binding transcriptional regulator/RsmH inhibitor MraZ